MTNHKKYNYLLKTDEATAAIDRETSEKIEKNLSKILKGRTVITIAHRLATIRNADFIFVLSVMPLILSLQ